MDALNFAMPAGPRGEAKRAQDSPEGNGVMMMKTHGSGLGRLLGDSPAMQAVYEMLEKAAKVDLPLLIIGETGTGKDLVAHELHARNGRAQGPFVVVSTSGIAREQTASEIFGHVKGAFAGADGDRIGRYQEADGGTLFLDEIGTMDAAMQAALLRVLEDGMFRPVGAPEDRQSNVRLIGATNVDLEKRVESGLFRADLFHRLKVLCIKVPALRDHKEDIPLLAEHFAQQLNGEFGFHIKSISPKALQYLQDQYDWPGNVRELKNVIAQAAVLAESGTILPEHLPARICDDPAKEAGPVDCDESDLPMSQSPGQDCVGNETNGGAQMAAKTSETIVKSPASRDGSSASSSREALFIPVGRTIDTLMKEYATLTLGYCEGNKTKAAKMLGVSRKTLHDRLKKWDAGEVPSEQLAEQ